MILPVKDKQTINQKNHFINSVSKFILASMLFLIFATQTLCELSLSNLKAINLYNGNIFIIHQQSVDVYDSTLTTKKNEYF